MYIFLFFLLFIKNYFVHLRMFNSKYNKMKTKKETLENEYKNLRNEFQNLHSQLLEKKEFTLASKLSEVYHESSFNQYAQGLEFMKNLYKL